MKILVHIPMHNFGSPLFTIFYLFIKYVFHAQIKLDQTKLSNITKFNRYLLLIMIEQIQLLKQRLCKLICHNLGCPLITVNKRINNLCQWDRTNRVKMSCLVFLVCNQWLKVIWTTNFINNKECNKCKCKECNIKIKWLDNN